MEASKEEDMTIQFVNDNNDNDAKTTTSTITILRSVAVAVAGNFVLHGCMHKYLW